MDAAERPSRDILLKMFGTNGTLLKRSTLSRPSQEREDGHAVLFLAWARSDTRCDVRSNERFRVINNPTTIDLR
jgi:hypothetical protein